VARPNKDGIDYFPLDVKFDDEVHIITSKFGPQGLGVLVILWQIIYNNGFFLQWSERELLLYRSRFNADVDLINDVINECIEWEIFSKSIYKKYGVLTSKGIQKRYIEATSRRKEVTFVKEYLLVDFKDKSFENYMKRVNVVINSLGDNIYAAKEDINTDIKIDEGIIGQPKNSEEPKPLKSKKPIQPKKPKKKAELTKAQMELFEKFWEVWPKKVSRGQAEITWEKLDANTEFTNQIIEGVKRSIKGDSRFKEGFTPHASTWLNAKGWLDEFTDDGKKKPEPSNKFINFEQRDYDFDKIEKKAMEMVLNENGGV